MFNKFESISDDELNSKNEIFSSHSSAVIEKIGCAMEHLEEPEFTHSLLRRLGKEHQQRGIDSNILKVINSNFFII
jgi:hypothetical protein